MNPRIVSTHAAALLPTIISLLLCGCGTKQRDVSKAMKYDVGTHAATDKSLLGYNEVDPIDIDLDEPRALAVIPGEAVLVAGDKTIAQVSGEGFLKEPISLTAEPRCLAAGKDNRIYVGLADHVEVYSASGEQLASWDALDDGAIVTSIAVAEADVFVADAGNDVVMRYGLDGEFIGRIGERAPDRDIPGIVTPSLYLDIGIGTDGLLWIANTGRLSMEAYTFEGNLEGSWGKASVRAEGFSGCCNPVHFAVPPEGGFVTSEKGIRRIKLYDEFGELQCLVAGPDELGKPDKAPADDDPNADAKGIFEVAVDSKGRVLALDVAKRQVRVFVAKAPNE